MDERFCYQINLYFDCKPNKIYLLSFLCSSFLHFSSCSIPYMLRFYFFYIFWGIGHIFLLNYCYVGSSCTWYSETLFVPGDSFSQHILVYTHTVARSWDVLGTEVLILYCVVSHCWELVCNMWCWLGQCKKRPLVVRWIEKCTTRCARELQEFNELVLYLPLGFFSPGLII